MKPYKSIYEKIVLPIEVGDTILLGKFKNKVATVTGFDTDNKNQPIIKTNKGNTGLKFRIKKLIDEK